MGYDIGMRGSEREGGRARLVLHGSGQSRSPLGPSRLLACAGLGASAILLVGCCDEGRREMERVAKEYGDAAHACCKMMLPGDPVGAAACFEDVKNWRLETGSKIIAWYQACLDGNRELANDVLNGLVEDVDARSGQSCGGLVTLADGRVATVGIPFGPDDRVTLTGRAVSPFGLLLPPQYEITEGVNDRVYELHIEGGAFGVEAFGAAVNGSLSGTLAIVQHAPSEYLVTGASWRFGVGASAITMELDDDHGFSRLRLDGQRGVLRLVMSTGVPEGMAVLMPPRLVLEVPVRAGGGALELDARRLPALSVMPGALGIADWNGDGAVTAEDWIAFFQTEPTAGVDPRDLDFDGDYDSDDIRGFVASWRQQMTHD
jgi:hypothetical protein